MVNVLKVLNHYLDCKVEINNIVDLNKWWDGKSAGFGLCIKRLKEYNFADKYPQ